MDGRTMLHGEQHPVRHIHGEAVGTKGSEWWSQAQEQEQALERMLPDHRSHMCSLRTHHCIYGWAHSGKPSTSGGSQIRGWCIWEWWGSPFSILWVALRILLLSRRHEGPFWFRKWQLSLTGTLLHRAHAAACILACSPIIAHDPEG
jgi:hypothetical protein